MRKNDSFWLGHVERHRTVCACAMFISFMALQKKGTHTHERRQIFAVSCVLNFCWKMAFSCELDISIRNKLMQKWHCSIASPTSNEKKDRICINWCLQQSKMCANAINKYKMNVSFITILSHVEPWTARTKYSAKSLRLHHSVSTKPVFCCLAKTTSTVKITNVL